MKKDCSTLKNYIEEKNRMTNGCNLACACCPLGSYNNKRSLPCVHFEAKFLQQAVQIVQQWSDEHSIKTNLDDFKEKYPNARLGDYGLPLVEPCKLSYRDNMECSDCPGCQTIWNQPFKEA